MFLNTASTKHRKLRRLQSTGSGTGVVRRWVGGRGGSAYNLRHGHGLRGQRPDPMVSLSFPHHFPRPTLRWQPRRGSPRPSPRHCPRPRWHCTPTARTRRKRGLSGNPADLGEFWWIFGVIFGEQSHQNDDFWRRNSQSCLFVTCWEPNIFVEFW